jgi:hypothetical protein
MRCWAIELELGGRVYEIPALPAVDWWPVLSAADTSMVLDLVTSSDLDERLLAGEVDGASLVETCRDAVEEAAGRSFHASVILAYTAESQWPVINGRLAQRGFRWDQQPLGAALDAIYSIVAEALEKDPLEKFLALLDNEALTQPGKKRQTPKRIVNEFETMAGPRPTGGVKSTGGPSGSGRPKTQPRLQPPRQPARSGAPRRPRGPRAGSDPAASS